MNKIYNYFITNDHDKTDGRKQEKLNEKTIMQLLRKTK